MQILEKIFSYYDQIISGLSFVQQGLISLFFLLILVWLLYMIFKSGHWIFIVLFIILLPSTWPATKKIAFFIWLIFKFLLVRIMLLFS